MQRRPYFQLLYYTQIPLVILAMVLTGSIGVVLFGQILWEVIILVGLSTYFTYSLDNLIDWGKDQDHYTQILVLIKPYHMILAVLIPASALGIILLTLRSTNDFQIVLLLLGGSVAMGIARFSNYRNNSWDGIPLLWKFMINRVFISTIWTIVCVFLPIWYKNESITTVTWHIFFYIFGLIFTYSVLWKFEKSDYGLKKKICNAKMIGVLTIFPVISSIFVIYDVVFGLLPIFNLINLLSPIACLFGLFFISKSPIRIRQKINVLTISLTIFSTLTAVVFQLFGS